MRKGSKYRRLLATLIATIAVAAASIVATTSASSAATTSSTSASASQATHMAKKTAPMHIERVTKLVSATPDKHGNVKVQLANGKIAPIPQSAEKKVMARAAQEPAKSNTGIVTADCGESYITVRQKATDGTPGGTSIYDGNPVGITTGFLVNLPAVAYTWVASISGPNGYSYDYTAAGTLAADTSWDGNYDSPVDEPSGEYTAGVDPVVSEAVLADGDVCFSGGPTDTQKLVAQARCLNQKPTDAYDAGSLGGWIEQTTTPVDHINITTTPNGPGTRAASAVACLNDPGALGTDPGSDPTGYADATDFVTANGYDPTRDLARCHLIAKAMGGRGIQANLFPCWQDGANTGANSMATPVEYAVNNAISTLNTGEAVYYTVSLNYYDNDSTIPNDIVTSAYVQHTDGTSTLVANTVDVINNAPTDDQTLNMGN